MTFRGGSSHQLVTPHIASPQGVENLFERMERMVAQGPVFCDITWGAGGSTADVTLDIATRMQTVVCVWTMTL